MKTNILKVVSVEEGPELVDKNKKAFRKITVKTPSVIMAKTDEGEIPVKVKSRVSSFNAWPESYLKSMKGMADFGYDLQVGDAIAGTIVKRECLTTLKNEEGEITGFATTYEIEDAESNKTRKASSYSAVVLADSADEAGFEQAVKEAFWSAGHPLATDARVKAIAGPALLAEPVGSLTGAEHVNS